MDAPGIPLWEREFAEAFIRADAVKDWEKLGAMWPQLEGASRPHPLLLPTVCLLARFDMAALTGALRHIDQTPLAMQIIDELTVSQRLLIAEATRNPTLQFAALFRSFKVQHVISPISSSDGVKAADVLIAISTDERSWRSMMAVFGRHPPHFAALQTTLGRALARTSPLAVSAYVDALTLSRCQTPGDERRKAVSSCLAAFHANADFNLRQELWRAAYARWRSWRFDAADPNAHMHAVQWSELDYAVSAYFIECTSANELAEALSSVQERLGGIEGQWHSSRSHCTSEWFRLLSEFQPIAHSSAVLDGHHSLEDLKHMYLPDGLHDNAYTDLMFGSASRAVR